MELVECQNCFHMQTRYCVIVCDEYSQVQYTNVIESVTVLLNVLFQCLWILVAKIMHMVADLLRTACVCLYTSQSLVDNMTDYFMQVINIHWTIVHSQAYSV